MHSPQGIANFSNDFATAVLQLASFKDAETLRIAPLADTPMPDETTDSLILRSAIDRGVIAYP